MGYQPLTDQGLEVAMQMAQDRQRIFAAVYQIVKDDMIDLSDEDIRQIATGHMIALDRGWGAAGLNNLAGAVTPKRTKANGPAPEPQAASPSPPGGLDALDDEDIEDEIPPIEIFVPKVRGNANSLIPAVVALVPEQLKAQYGRPESAKGILRKIGGLLNLTGIPGDVDENSQDMRELLLRGANGYMQLQVSGMEKDMAIQLVEQKLGKGQL